MAGRAGPFESRYVRNDRIREVDDVGMGGLHRAMELYDIDGKLEKEWEETK